MTAEERARWLERRRARIGASEAAALFDLHPYISAYSLWADKTGEARRTDDDAALADQREFGLVVEPYLRSRYARETGLKVTTLQDGLIVEHPTCAALACTPDALVVGPESGANPLQLKTAAALAPGEELPAYWQVQIQVEMACLQASEGAFSILGSFNRWFHASGIAFNEAFATIVAEKAEEFWEFVRRGTPPPADGSKATTEALKRLHPADDGTTVDLPASAGDWVRELKELKAAKLIADRRIDEIENALRAAIGPSTYGRLPDGTGWTLRTTTREAHTVSASTFRVLRRSEKLLKA